MKLMKKPILSLLAIVLALSFLVPLSGLASSRHGRKSKAVDGQEEAHSVVSEVTLFRDRASVKRLRKVSLPKGATTVVFHDVTPLADLESLKASLSEKKELTLMGIRTESEYAVKSGNKGLETWIDKRKSAERKRQEIVNQVNLLIQGNQNLNLLTQHYRDSFSLNLHQNTWTKGGFEAFVQFLTSQSDRLNGSWAKLYEAYHAVSKDLEEASAHVQTLTSASDRHTLTVSVDLLADSSVTANVEIQYLVSHCGWSSAYDVRVKSSEDRAAVEQYAFVWQKSGEDWSDVALTLSNVQSELRPEIPSISPYTLSYREAAKVQTTISGATDSASSLTVGNSKEPSTEGAEKGIEKNFKVPGLQTIRDGMARTRVFIARKDSSYSERLELVGAEYDRVFRKGDLENPFDWDLEAGPASVYYNGDFLQQSTLDRVAKGNHFGINAGVDHDFQVSRWVEDKIEKPGIIDTKKHFLRGVHVSLRNFSARRKSVRVYEQVPISEIKEVVVETKKTSPGIKEDAANPGWRYWDVAAASRNSETISMNLDVAVPSSFNFSW